MLDQMTSSQYLELITYFAIRAEEKERLEADAQEAKLRQFFSRKIAQQNAEQP